MKNRIFRSMSILVLVAVLLTTLVVGGVFGGKMYNAMKAQLHSEAVLMEEALEAGDRDYLERVGDDIPNIRITLIAEDGTVEFDNLVKSDGAENHNERPEVNEARLYGTGEEVRKSVSIGKKSVYYAVLLDTGEVLRLGHTMSTLWWSLLHTLPFILVFSLLVLSLATILARKQVERIIVPINELDLEHPEQEKVYDELSPLLSRISAQNTQIQSQMKELEDRRQELYTLTEYMSEGLVMLNADGCMISINRRAMEIFDLEDNTCLKQHFLTVNRNPSLQKMIEETLKGEEQEVCLKLKGRTYQIISTPIVLSGTFKGIVLFFLDVTEKQQQEQMRREFTANVSHELRTPLTSISGYAEIMAGGLVKEEDMKPFAKKIHEEANGLIALVSDIIKLSRLDENGTGFEWEKVDLRQIAEDTKKRLSDYAFQNEVELKVEGESAFISGIPQILKEILYNLAENAVKYNHKDGRVVIRVKNTENGAEVSVKDNGIGIPPEEQGRIFERFYRVDKSHSKNNGGTGLGLSIVKHGTLLHRGEILLKSRPEKGTEILLWFPHGE